MQNQCLTRNQSTQSTRQNGAVFRNHPLRQQSIHKTGTGGSGLRLLASYQHGNCSLRTEMAVRKIQS